MIGVALILSYLALGVITAALTVRYDDSEDDELLAVILFLWPLIAILYLFSWLCEILIALARALAGKQ